MKMSKKTRFISALMCIALMLGILSTGAAVSASNSASDAVGRKNDAYTNTHNGIILPDDVFDTETTTKATPKATTKAPTTQLQPTKPQPTQPQQTQPSVNNNDGDKIEVQQATPSKVAGVKAKAGKKKVTVTWKASKNAKKYVIKYSYKKNMKSAKIKTVKNLKVVLKKLKSKKKVYIQVQGVNGNTYGKWSKKISVKVK